MAKKILVADDSRTLRRCYQIAFAREDVQVLLADNGEDALQLAKQQSPDLLILDHRMPGKTGYEICAAAKADPVLSGIPVLIACSNQEPFDTVKGAGADGHLIKPFDTGKMVEQVQAFLARAIARPFIPAAPAPRPAAAAQPAPAAPPPVPTRAPAAPVQAPAAPRAPMAPAAAATPAPRAPMAPAAAATPAPRAPMAPAAVTPAPRAPKAPAAVTPAPRAPMAPAAVTPAPRAPMAPAAV
ncbi:MAG: response regulator, partial [Polyangia bacterium]|nr:response regulator [Polyangia bacterium]